MQNRKKYIPFLVLTLIWVFVAIYYWNVRLVQTVQVSDLTVKKINDTLALLKEDQYCQKILDVKFATGDVWPLVLHGKIELKNDVVIDNLIIKRFEFRKVDKIDNVVVGNMFLEFVSPKDPNYRKVKSVPMFLKMIGETYFCSVYFSDFKLSDV